MSTKVYYAYLFEENAEFMDVWEAQKCRPEDVVEAAWKAVPKYTWWRCLLYKFKRIFSFRKG